MKIVFTNASCRSDWNSHGQKNKAGVKTNGYADVFGAHKPARAITISPHLHYVALIEVQAITAAWLSTGRFYR